MALILHIETASTNCSVALSKHGKTIALKEDNSKNYSHAEALHKYIHELFKSTNTHPKSIDAIAVSKGPGSYTGLRIGVSTAKGLCYALNKPLLSVSTLQTLAQQVVINEGYIVAMSDARRMEVYSATYNANYELTTPVEAKILDSESYKDLLNTNNVYFIGSGVYKTKQLITHPNAFFIDDKLPSAKEMGRIGYSKYNAQEFEDIAYFEPYYLKDFVAIKPKKQNHL